MMSPSPLLLAQADSARAIASVYTMSLLATLPIALAAIAALVLRRASAEARSLIWRSALVAMLVVVVGRQLPLQWIAWVVPAFFAMPLVALGRLQVNATSVQSGSVENVPIWITLLFAIYIAGVLAILTPMIVSSVMARRRLRSSTAVTGAAWSSAIADVSRQLGIARRVRVFIAPSAVVPMTWGFLHPVVVLPLAACAWSDDERRIVLMHELVHV
ncbi:MAG TPA: M56 family metallopeptidase, partial [Gemmatimonadaceae bacterium]